MSQIKVLVVDDSAFMRKVVSDIINSNKNTKVIDTARNGIEAIEKVKTLSPDVITMDIEMPIMDGLTALKEIMNKYPTPTLMLSSLTMDGADATIQALNLGAVDFITKPSSIFKVNTEDMKNNLINKIIIASKINTKKHLKLSSSTTIIKKNIKKLDNYRVIKKGSSKIVLIGTSTGGPRALQTIIPKLPKSINASILIVQHMPSGFTKSLANRLNSISEIHVKEAEDKDILVAGRAYIAPGGFHMKLIDDNNRLMINLTKEKPVSGHRPSVDTLFNSVAKLNINNIIGVILTGMGSDGAKGLSNLKPYSDCIIAQDEESCVVFGMPKSAIKLGIVDKILPLEEISEEIIKAVEV